MHSNPHEHIKQIISYHIRTEEKLAVLAYIDKLKANNDELLEMVDVTQSRNERLEKENRKINNARGF